MANINGFGGTATFASQTIPVESWQATVECETLDTTNVSNSGWQSNIAGCKKASGSFKGFWDASSTATGTLGLVEGSSGTLTLLLGNTNQSMSGPARIGKVDVENSAKGVVTYSASFESNGVWTLPS